MRASRIAASISASVVTILANSGMCFPPKLDELVEMLCRYLQDVLYIAAARISGPYSIASIRTRNLLLRFVAEFHHDFSLRIESMHVAGLMILKRSEEHTSELQS